MASQIPGQSGTNLGLAPNVAGLLCYLPLCCVGIVFSLVAVIVEKQSRFVRFHAFQSLLLFGVCVALALVVQVLSMVVSMVVGGMAGLLFSMLGWIVGLGVLAVSIYMMIKAYGGEETALPVIGEMARKWA